MIGHLYLVNAINQVYTFLIYNVANSIWNVCDQRIPQTVKPTNHQSSKTLIPPSEPDSAQKIYK